MNCPYQKPANDESAKPSGSKTAAAQCVDIGPCEMSESSSPDPISFLENLIQLHGDCVRYRTPFGQITLFNNPRHVRQLLQDNQFQRLGLLDIVLGKTLLTTDGAPWRKRRTLMQPHFLRDRVKSIAPVITTVIASSIDRWEAATDSGSEIEITGEMNLLTVDVISRALFSKQFTDHEIKKICSAVSLLITDLAGLQSLVLGSHLSISPQRNKKFREAVNTIDEIIFAMIAERRKDRSKSGDLLASLISAKNEKDQPMSDQEIRNEVVTMLISGHETTSMSLSWAWHLLAENPEAEAKLHRELDEVLEGRSPTIDDISNLHWTTMVLKETMRMYPPIWILVRRAENTKDISGVQIRGGDSAIACIYTVQRHPDHWYSPDEFCPERFEERSVHPFPEDAYIPFGHGSHHCIGLHMTMLEQTMALAALAQRFRVRPLAGQVVEPLAGVTLRMQPGLRAHLERR